MQFIRKTLFIITLSTASTILSFGQQRQADSLTALVTAMAHSNIYESSYAVGFAGSVSKQFQRYEQLKALATDQQLLNLAEHHKYAVVRLYALQALKKRKVVIPEELMRKFSHDKTLVKTLNGCTGDEKPLNELLNQDLKSPFELSD